MVFDLQYLAEAGPSLELATIVEAALLPVFFQVLLVFILELTVAKAIRVFIIIKAFP